jgi:hypothetical protein
MAGVGASVGAHGELAGEGKKGEGEEGEGAQLGGMARGGGVLQEWAPWRGLVGCCCYGLLRSVREKRNVRRTEREEEERKERKKKKKWKEKEKETNMENFTNLKIFGEKNKRQFMKLVKIISLKERKIYA